MGVISIRLTQDVDAFLRKRGIRPGILGRHLIEEEVRRIRLRESRQTLANVSRKPTKPIVALLREERDAH